jgi:hypothetical protein
VADKNSTSPYAHENSHHIECSRKGPETLEIDARLPGGAPDNVVRTVTENSRTLKFTSQDFEED